MKTRAVRGVVAKVIGTTEGGAVVSLVLWDLSGTPGSEPEAVR